MSSAVTKIIKIYKISPQMTPSELSRYTDELTKDLSRGFRDQARRRLRQIGYNEEQGNSIKDMDQSILKNNNLSHMEINEDASIAYSHESATDIAKSSRLSYLRRDLRKNGASEDVIETTKHSWLTEEYNRLQKMRREMLTCQKLDLPDHFMPEAILERLQGYSIYDSPSEQALADIITMLCMRPAEVTTLHIANGYVTEYAKGRGIGLRNSVKWKNMKNELVNYSLGFKKQLQMTLCGIQEYHV
ncbi:2170_t:CDS:2 [Acaulospora colombiana]|uniref:2170_t:CDS:1 n=1 Tax=Acaulospora colombiana TaxID=27376 RepID=A0ACA9KXH6_9GLOM|nr:2170_t:CDS:2 [Acaulospora colombiana]